MVRAEDFSELDSQEIAARLQQQLSPVADEHLVQHTLDRLAGAGLLEGWAARTAEEARTSRRQFVRKAGLVGALSLLLPAVTTIVAPMPGTVTRILAEPGADLPRGSPLIVLEAMKMEHTLRAPADGRLQALKCAVGDVVQEGAELAEFEPFL